MSKHHTIDIKAKKAKLAKHHVDGLDTLDWQIDAIATDKHLRAKSTALGFDVSGTDGDKTLSYPLNYSGPRHFTASYQLFEEGNGSSTQILGPNGEDLDLVIDTIGGMTPKPPDDEGRDEGGHRHGQHGGQG